MSNSQLPSISKAKKRIGYLWTGGHEFNNGANHVGPDERARILKLLRPVGYILGAEAKPPARHTFIVRFPGNRWCSVSNHELRELADLMPKKK